MKSIFFDWDGTLVDSIPLLFASHNHVRGVMGLPEWSHEEYFKFILYSTRELYPKVYGPKAAEAQDILYQYIADNHLERLNTLKGAIDILEYLHSRKVPMGVVSNKRHDTLEREIRHLGWDRFFGCYVGAGVAEFDKPSPAPLLYALAAHPDKPNIENVLYVGDMESDLACAEGAGCPCAFLTHTNNSAELVERYKPAYVAGNLGELKHKLMEFLDGPPKKGA